MVVFIDNVVLGTVHMHVKKGVMRDIADLVCSTFTAEEILTAKTQLITELSMAVQGGHVDTVERTAASLYAKELVELVSSLDKEGKMPKIVVCSDQLARIPIGKGSLATGDVVPLSSRMSDLENIVTKLSDSFEKFRQDSMRPTSFAAARARLNSTQGMGGGVGGGAVGGGVVAGQGGAPPMVNQGQGVGSWAGVAGQHVQHAQGQQGQGQGGKRKNDETGTENFTPVQPRRPRKTNYGKSTLSMAGAEAAPVDIFVGNTNPQATPEIVKDVLIKYAQNLPDKPVLNVLEVKCLNNMEIEPNPRSRCWKVSVAYAQKEIMEKDELYPAGWSHRKFFPPRNNKNGAGNNAKRPHVDPVVPYLSGGSNGGQNSNSM